MRILKYLHISRLFLSYFLMIVIIITICINPSNLFCSTFTITSSNTVTITTTSLRSNQRFNNIISPKIRCQELSSNNNKLFRYDDSIFLTKTTLHSAVSIPTTITESDAIIVDYNIQQYDKKVIKDPKVGVFLLNLGGPETGDDVEGMFLFYYFVCLFVSLSLFFSSLLFSFLLNGIMTRKVLRDRDIGALIGNE